MKIRPIGAEFVRTPS